MRKALLSLGVLGLPAVGRAQPTAVAEGLPYSPGHYLAQALLSLGLVVALIWGATFLLRRLGAARWGTSAGGLARIVQSVPLSGGYVLHIMQIGERLYGVICGPGGAALSELAETAERTKEEERRTPDGEGEGACAS